MSVRKSRRIQDKVMATSTPNTIYEASSNYSEKNFSPILNHKRKENRHFPDEYDSSASDSSTEHSTSEVTSNNQTVPNKIPVRSHGRIAVVIGSFLTLLLAIVASFQAFSSDISINSSTLVEVQKKFPSQSEDFWDAISSGINEVKIFNKPSVFLLLYDYDGSKTIDLFLHAVSRYASGILNEDYNTQPIIITSSTLNTVKARSDYGYIITKYKPELEKKSVMIVKNLDKIPGEVAQAFHSMCDEYTPLVGKTMFLFTIQVRNLTSQKSDHEVVEDILKKSWHDLDDDLFYPLLTRITSMVLKIEPEQTL